MIAGLTRWIVGRTSSRLTRWIVGRTSSRLTRWIVGRTSSRLTRWIVGRTSSRLTRWIVGRTSSRLTRWIVGRTSSRLTRWSSKLIKREDFLSSQSSIEKKDVIQHPMEIILGTESTQSNQQAEIIRLSNTRIIGECRGD
jgi:hypothetical protein